VEDEEVVIQPPVVTVATPPATKPQAVVEQVTPQTERKSFYMWKHAEGAEWKIEALKLASEVSNNDLNFIRKITAENGHLAHDNQSTAYLRRMPSGKNQVCKGDLTGCVREQSYGYCQVYKPAHPEKIADPRFFTDKRWQMELCYSMYKGGTPMYAQYRPISEFYLMDI
jgi:hypothetical protein